MLAKKQMRCRKMIKQALTGLAIFIIFSSRAFAVPVDDNLKVHYTFTQTEGNGKPFLRS